MTLPTEYKKVLQENICLVQFRKIDGSIRDMRCTLQESYLPPAATTGTGTRAVNPNIVTVFDIDKQEWRSFRKDQVTSFAAEVVPAAA